MGDSGLRKRIVRQGPQILPAQPVGRVLEQVVADVCGAVLFGRTGSRLAAIAGHYACQKAYEELAQRGYVPRGQPRTVPGQPREVYYGKGQPTIRIQPTQPGVPPISNNPRSIPPLQQGGGFQQPSLPIPPQTGTPSPRQPPVQPSGQPPPRVATQGGYNPWRQFPQQQAGQPPTQPRSQPPNVLEIPQARSPGPRQPPVQQRGQPPSPRVEQGTPRVATQGGYDPWLQAQQPLPSDKQKPSPTPTDQTPYSPGPRQPEPTVEIPTPPYQGKGTTGGGGKVINTPGSDIPVTVVPGDPFIIAPNPVYVINFVASLFEVGRIRKEKQTIQDFFTPIFRYLQKEYNFYVRDDHFLQFESEGVKREFSQHPEIGALQPEFLAKARLIDKKYFASGAVDSVRIANQFLANAAINGWSVAQTRAVWNAIPV